MPVLSPHRSGSSGTYRNSFSSALDRPYYGTSSYSPRISSSYSERFSTRSYTDADGRRIYSRSGSITEDGVTTRYREESREGSMRRDSVSRDSGISSIRENSVLDYPRRDSSLSRSEREGSRLSTVNVIDSVAEMRNKYSPANYIPACMRKNENISRSKSINDIGLPPIETKTKQKKVNNSLNHNSNLFDANNTNNDNSSIEDDNGNQTSVADLRKKFDDKPYAYTPYKPSKNSSPPIERPSNYSNTSYKPSKSSSPPIEHPTKKISENLFKKLDNLDDSKKKLIDDKLYNYELKEHSPEKSKVNNFLKKQENTEDQKEKSPTIDQASTKVSENIFKKQDNLEGKSVKSTKSTSVKSNKVDPLTKITVKRKAGTKTVVKKDKSSDSLSNLSNTHDTSVEKTSNNATDKLSVNNISNSISHEPLKLESSEKREKPISNGSNIVGIDEDVLSEDSINDLNQKSSSRVNNFASYIPSKSFQKGDDCSESNIIVNGDNDEDTSTNVGIANGITKHDIATSPKLNSRSTISPTSSSITATSNSTNSVLNSSNSIPRRSVEPSPPYTNSDPISDLYRNRYYTSPEKASISTLDRHISQNNNTHNHARDRVSPPIRTLGLNGLKNIGNTCFMNSVIQCLSNTRQLLEYLRKDAYVKDINTSISSMKGALIKAFAEVIKEVWSEESCDRVVNTVSLKSQIQRFAPRFMGYAQQDAQEFLRYLLEGLHEDVNRVIEKPKPIHTEIDENLSDNEKSRESWSRYLRMDNSKIVDIFVGQFKSTLRCTHCGHASVTFDPFWDLSLPIPQKRGELRLSQCLDSFTREETMDGEEKPTCSKCKERRKCTKSFTIQKFPKILVIHLKRFSPTERFRGKLNVTVEFPLEGLDMSNYAADSVAPARYNLYAISNHSGTTYSGHYTAYCRHPYAHSWHEYNDSRVSPISPHAIISGEAYVLFYELEGQKSHL